MLSTQRFPPRVSVRAEYRASIKVLSGYIESECLNLISTLSSGPKVVGKYATDKIISMLYKQLVKIDDKHYASFIYFIVSSIRGS